MPFLGSIADIWEKTPKLIQRSIAFGITVGFILCMLMALWLVWGSGYFQERLGIPITRQDLQEQTETLQTDQHELIQATVAQAIIDYDQHLQQYLSDKEEHARRTILDPILKGMEALEKNQLQLMRAQNSTDREVRDIPKVFDSKLEHLIEKTKRDEERQREREVLEELLRRALKEDQDVTPTEPERPPKKSTIRL